MMQHEVETRDIPIRLTLLLKISDVIHLAYMSAQQCGLYLRRYCHSITPVHTIRELSVDVLPCLFIECLLSVLDPLSLVPSRPILRAETGIIE
jgi:hypothetical protein